MKNHILALILSLAPSLARGDGPPVQEPRGVIADEFSCNLWLFHNNTGESDRIGEAVGASVREVRLPRAIDFPTRVEEGVPEETWVKNSEGRFYLFTRFEDFEVRAETRYRIAETSNDAKKKVRAAVSACQRLEIRELPKGLENGRVIAEKYSSPGCKPTAKDADFWMTSLDRHDPPFQASRTSTWRKSEFQLLPVSNEKGQYDHLVEMVKLDGRLFSKLFIDHPSKKLQQIYLNCFPSGVVHY